MGKKVMISLPDELLDDIDKAADEEHRTRSEFIREAARRYLSERSDMAYRPIDNPRVREAIAAIDRISQKIDSNWESSSVVRELRDRDKPAADHDIT